MRFATVSVVTLLVLSLCVGGTVAAPSWPSVDEVGPTTSVGPATAPSAGTPTSSSAAPSIPSSSGSSQTGVDRQIRLTQELALTPDTPGEIDVTLTYEIPDDVVELSTTVPEGADVTETDGFRATDDRTYEWRGTGNTAWLTYSVPVNQTHEGTGPFAERPGYIFVDVGEWALVARPQVSTRWGWTGGGAVTLDRTVTTAGPGAVGSHIVFLGEHDEHERTAHGQTIGLIVPTESTLVDDPEEILDAFSFASDALRVGSRDTAVFVVAAPSDEVEWAMRGIQIGPADVWVLDDEPLADPDNVWLHEYVHTRQSYEATEETRWFTEGSAVYYAALLSLEGEYIDFDDFRGRLGSGASLLYRDAVLSDPSTWSRHPDYHVGALVAGELDRRIRLASENERSLQDVLRAMNELDGEVTQSAFLSAVEDAGDAEVREAAERYTQTTERASMWTHGQHRDAFGTMPALVETTIADDETAYRVSGPYRDRALGPLRPIHLVPGETLAFDVTVHNSGETTGSYEVTMRIDGEPHETKRGRIDPGEVTPLEFQHTFDRVGTYEIGVGEGRFEVRVTEPADPVVEDVHVDRTTIEPGSAVTLSATVRNDAIVPGHANLSVTVDDEQREMRTVRLDAGESTNVSFVVGFDEPGEYALGLGDERLRITVDTASSPQVEEQSGFGTGITAFAIAVLSIALLARAAITVPSERRRRGRR